ncbi:Flagellar hook-length control protein FliK [Gluconobacter japonicus]|nr:Flagellar hook-length control protein FliK [Gluconobacter japonicus]
MSQILPSAYVGGDHSQSSVLVGAQLASTERFQDFLKSYVHTGEEPVAKAPAHRDVAQLGQKKDTDTSLKTRNPVEDNKAQKASSPSAAEEQNALSQKSDQKIQKSPESKADTQPVQLRSDRPLPPAEKISFDSAEKDGQSKSSFETEETKSDASSIPVKAVQNTPAVPAGRGDSNQVLNLAIQISPESEQVLSSEPVSIQNTATGRVAPECDNAIQPVDDNLADSAVPSLVGDTSEGEGKSVGNGFSVLEQMPAQENIPSSETSASLLTSAPNVGAEASDGSKRQAPSVETVSVRSDVRSIPAPDIPVISHTSSDSHLNTEIEMSLGESGKVHVSIDETEGGERHVHIRAENPDVLQSLTDDKSNLFSTLNQSVISVSSDQLIIPTDLTLSLMGNFSQSSRDGSGQGNRSTAEDAEHPGSSLMSRNKTQASVQSSRTMLRGVVDLTA